MSKVNSQPVYGPDEWDIDFSFDLEPTVLEYLIFGCYLLFAIPVKLLINGVQGIYSLITGLFSRKRDKEDIPGADYGLLSMISKIF